MAYPYGGVGVCVGADDANELEAANPEGGGIAPEPRYGGGVVVVRYIEDCRCGGIADIGVGAAVGGIVCGIVPCSGNKACTDAGRGTGVEEEGGVAVFVGSNSANVFCVPRKK